MSNRYRVEAALLGQHIVFHVIDSLLARSAEGHTVAGMPDVTSALDHAKELNAKELNAKADVTKAAFDAHTMAKAWIKYKDDARERIDADTAGAANRDDGDAISYYIYSNGMRHIVKGDRESIDALRALMARRWHRSEELQKVNRVLRLNMHDAQQTANDFKAQLAEMCKQCSVAQTDLTAIYETMESRTIGVTAIEHIRMLEQRVKDGAYGDAYATANYWRAEKEAAQNELEALRQRIKEL